VKRSTKRRLTAAARTATQAVKRTLRAAAPAAACLTLALGLVGAVVYAGSEPEPQAASRIDCSATAEPDPLQAEVERAEAAQSAAVQAYRESPTEVNKEAAFAATWATAAARDALRDAPYNPYEEQMRAADALHCAAERIPS
jgi:hypothetical protein